MKLKKKKKGPMTIYSGNCEKGGLARYCKDFWTQSLIPKDLKSHHDPVRMEAHEGHLINEDLSKV